MAMCSLLTMFMSLGMFTLLTMCTCTSIFPPVTIAPISGVLLAHGDSELTRNCTSVSPRLEGWKVINSTRDLSIKSVACGENFW